MRTRKRKILARVFWSAAIHRRFVVVLNPVSVLETGFLHAKTRFPGQKPGCVWSYALAVASWLNEFPTPINGD
jgi:hypothetical protein